MAKKTRNGKYHNWITPEGLLKVEGWARDGLDNAQIAHNIGITEATLYNWINRFPQFNEALKKGKEVVDRQVENALLKRALGYVYIEETRERVGGHMMLTKSVTKHVVPDTTAQIFWLKNRKPSEWRDRKETNISGQLNTNNPFDELSVDELRQLIQDDGN